MFNEDASRLPGWVFDDFHPRAAGLGLACDVVECQTTAVQGGVTRRLAPIAEMTRYADRVMRSGLVELLARRHAPLGEGTRASKIIRRGAHRHRDDPLPGWDVARDRTND